MRLSIAFVAIVCATTTHLSAQIISTNINRFSADLVTGPAGVVSASNWNNTTGNSAVPFNLMDDSGALTGAMFSSSNASGPWSSNNPQTGVTENGNLMTGYSDNFQGDSFTITGLPSLYTTRGYDVYIYHATDSAGVMGFEVDDGNVVEERYGRQAGGGGTNYPLAGPDGFVISTDATDTGANTTASNVVLFEDLTGANLTITGIAGSIADNRARPSGFQIVANEAVPEPATLAIWAVLGFSLAGFGFWRSRKRSIRS